MNQARPCFIACALSERIARSRMGELVGGALVGWYPYPFLNPARVGGFVGVASYFVAIALGLGLSIAATLWVARRGAVGPRHGAA